MKVLRHVGKLANTGQRIVVVYRKLPDDEDHALVVQTDTLPDMMHQNLMSVVESNIGQSTVDLYTVLHTTAFANGSLILETLHGRGFLQKVKVENVILHPQLGVTLPLAMANGVIDGKQPMNKNNDTNDAVPNSVIEDLSDKNRDLPTDVVKIAMSKVEQAKLLEQDATRLREEAYSLDPSLRPAQGRPELTAEEKERRREQRNIKRREKYKKEKEPEQNNIEQ